METMESQAFITNQQANWEEKTNEITVQERFERVVYVTVGVLAGVCVGVLYTVLA